MDKATVQQFSDLVKQELGLRSFDVFLSSDNTLYLSMLAVEKGAQKQGTGSAAMERLVAFADANGLRITLTTGQRDAGFGTTSQSRLITFYKRFGFVHNSGRKKDFSISGNMYRDPKMKKQTFREFYNHRLIETPLPDDWDAAIFNERVPFAKRVAYAKQRASKAGAGSSRIAYIIPFEGRQTILKVAKNVKGMAQNEAEAELLGDYYLRDTGIIIPMIDYDEQNSRPTWIHVEYAAKARDSDFVKACGGTLDDLMAFSIKQSGKPQNRYYTSGDPSKIDEDNEFAYGLTQLIGNYDIPVADFGRLANWGIYNGQPVIIDLGLSSDVLKNHYS